MNRYLISILILLFISGNKISAQKKSSKEQSVQELIEKGIEHHDAREFKEAITSYEKALKINPESMITNYELALSYLAMRDYRNASKYSSKVIESKDKDLMVGAYGVKSESLAETGKVDEAISLLENALIRNGNDYYLHFNLALNYFKKGDLDKTIEHVDNALNLNKSQSGAYLLSAYALKDKEIWVQSILSFQIFLLMEPDSHRSKNAFEEMLQVMQIKESSEKPVERSFIQKQLERQINKNDTSTSTPEKSGPPLTMIHGVDRETIYKAIQHTKDSLNTLFSDTLNIDNQERDSLETDEFVLFKEVTRTVFTALKKENDGTKTGFIWGFHVPITTKVLESDYFDIYSRYISVAYFPESFKWWEENQESAAKFVRWFEKGDESE